MFDLSAAEIYIYEKAFKKREKEQSLGENNADEQPSSDEPVDGEQSSVNQVIYKQHSMKQNGARSNADKYVIEEQTSECK